MPWPTIVGCGLARGIGHPSVFDHAEEQIWTLVHGDDYCNAGLSKILDWLQEILEKPYKIKMQRIGRGKDLGSKGKLRERQVLSRIISPRTTATSWRRTCATPSSSSSSRPRGRQTSDDGRC